MSTPTFVPSIKTPKRFTLTAAIRTRKALRLASGLTQGQRVRLGQASATINAAFKLN